MDGPSFVYALTAVVVVVCLVGTVASQVNLRQAQRRQRAAEAAFAETKRRYELGEPVYRSVVVQNDQAEFDRQMTAVLRDVKAAGALQVNTSTSMLPIQLERDSLTGEITHALILRGEIQALLPPEAPTGPDVP